MTKLLMITSALMFTFLFLGNSFGGPRQSMAAEANIPTDAQASPPTASTPTTQAYDENGNPMTPEEFAKAYKARMEAKSAATRNRLEARQSKWKKNNKETSPQEPSATTK